MPSNKGKPFESKGRKTTGLRGYLRRRSYREFALTNHDFSVLIASLSFVDVVIHDLCPCLPEARKYKDQIQLLEVLTDET